ncbi:MAG: ammonia-forming cytochrome c nitrite reductase subunit c552 [Planctomycetota bacterium]
MSTTRQWIVWLVLTASLSGYLAFSLVSQPGVAARTFLPGETTHGHYQIELQCNECHSSDFGAGVSNDACVRCHGADLERSTDTHPKSKFTDPGKAHLVKRIDGRSCISCHEEHVPDRTLAMGLSLPGDYCWHCHQEIGDQRPSHQGMAYDSCATAGCHNYHDNRALFESFLVKHVGEPEMLNQQRVPQRTFGEAWAAANPDRRPLAAADHDAPSGVVVEDAVVSEWAATAHAAAGVNCTECHTGESSEGGGGGWVGEVDHNACRSCHDAQVAGFLEGRHGMKLSVGLEPMTPATARLPMKHSAFHNELTCVACHGSHGFDTQFAAADACLKCHNDEHSLAYEASPHGDLWRQEIAGEAPPGAGVSCATCHMPREKEGESVFVQHNQNNNLRPNEKMVRTVCTKCHGLQFTLDALADPALAKNNYNGAPAGRVESIDMAKAWSDERERMRLERKRKRAEQKAKQAARAPGEARAMAVTHHPSPMNASAGRGTKTDATGGTL